MGCCQAKPGGISKADRATRWRTTGIVAVRDSKLKVTPRGASLFRLYSLFFNFPFSGTNSPPDMMKIWE